MILSFSSVYLLGMAGLTGLNAAPGAAPRFNAAPAGGYAPTRAMFWAFMYLIALGERWDGPRECAP